jgi:dTDP-6-deoxy-L-talose 4-dehydrogenase (NAD+)
MKNILITGAAGFVGRKVLNSLSVKDVSLSLVVRESQSLEFINLPNIANIFVTKDLFLEDMDWWSQKCAGIDTIIHAAWYAEPGQYLQSTKNFDCLIGSLNLVKGAISAGVRRFIGVGTCFEYDLSAAVLSIDSSLKPSTPYADSKLALFIALSHMLHEYDVEFAWCRLFYLYGDGENPRRLVPYLRSKLAKGEYAELTSGNQIRDFMNVTDVGRIISDVALGGSKGAINVCSGVPITVKQLALKIADEYGRRDLLKFGARPDNLIDPPCVIGVPNYEFNR